METDNAIDFGTTPCQFQNPRTAKAITDGSDLVFRNAGWVRVSVLGQQAKGYDLELREPITGDRYVVQIKSQASRSDLDATVQQFSAADYRKVFFVVHSPASNLANGMDLPGHVELVDPSHLASLALEAGLSSWIEEKVA